MNGIEAIFQIIKNQNIDSHLEVFLSEVSNIEKLYFQASNHQLLPLLCNTIYDNDLKSYFDDDFLKAIKYFRDLNLERNEEILKQINSISEILTINNIDHCFLKGSAILIRNSYTNISSRMVGDIDILIDSYQLQNANNLLIKNNYKVFDISPDPVYKSHRHLPRLVNKNFIAAVELHSYLLSSQQNLLIPELVLAKKQKINGKYTPSKEHLLFHNIFNSQINDEAYYTWNFSLKALIDALLFTNHKNISSSISQNNNKYIRRFWLNASLYINEIKIKPSTFEKLKIKFLKFRYKFKVLNNLYLKLIFLWNRKHTFPLRAYYFIIDRNYRNYLLNKPLKFN